MSPLKEAQSPVTGQPSNIWSAQPDTTHQPPQSVKGETDNSGPPPPEVLQSLSNKDFTAWGEYLGKEKHEDYILWKKRMIGEGDQHTTNQNAGIENEQNGRRQEVGESSFSGLNSTKQEKVPGRERTQDGAFETKEKHDVSEEQKEN